MESLRSIPQVDHLLREVNELSTLGPAVARWLVRREVEAARARVLAGGDVGDVRALVARAAAQLRDRAVRRVINATGVVLHTNLGRAPLSREAIEAVARASAAAAVEFDVETGERGARAPVAATLAAALCDAEDALVVNNNAGALLLALSALARGTEVVVSRGELIEIGGEFRLPDVMEASGAVLREVGTTNRTHLRDYRRALSERTGLILKVHPSNYEIVGFTAQPPLADLVELARAHDVPLLFDIGSGLLAPEEGVLADEPDAATAIATGADLVCFSGDKLLGGPQAGVIAGRADLVERCRRHPIARAVRADKLTLAAMEATLWAHARGERESLPVWSMLDASPDELKQRAEALARDVPGATVGESESVPGGGSVPGRTLPSPVVVVPIEHPERLAQRLRGSDPPVVARVERGSVVLDLRTVPVDDDEAVLRALSSAVAGFEVRPARDDDARAISAVLIAAMRAAFHGIVPDDILASCDVDEFTVRRRRRIPELRAEGGQTFVSTAERGVVGFVTGGSPRDAGTDAASTGELYALYAHPDLWDTGVGRVLTAAIEGHFRARGLTTSYLWVFEQNVRARRFYERAGYEPDGTRKPNENFGGAIEVRYRKLL